MVDMLSLPRRECHRPLEFSWWVPLTCFKNSLLLLGMDVASPHPQPIVCLDVLCVNSLSPLLPNPLESAAETRLARLLFVSLVFFFMTGIIVMAGLCFLVHCWIGEANVHLYSSLTSVRKYSESLKLSVDLSHNSKLGLADGAR